MRNIPAASVPVPWNLLEKLTPERSPWMLDAESKDRYRGAFDISSTTCRNGRSEDT